MFHFVGVGRELSIRDWLGCQCGVHRLVKRVVIFGQTEICVVVMSFVVWSQKEAKCRSTLFDVSERCGGMFFLMGGECTDLWWPKAWRRWRIRVAWYQR